MFNKRLVKKCFFQTLGLIILGAWLLSCQPQERSAAPAAGQSPSPAAPRVLFIGLDAANWIVMEPMLREGKLPHFKQLIEQGVAASLQTFLPTESPLIWTTIATGLAPDRHGINSFTRRTPGRDDQVPLRSDMREAPAFWNLLSQAGRSAIVMKWWASWPAERVKGADYSSRLQPDLPAGQTWPAALYTEADTFRFSGQPPAKKHGTLVLPGKAGSPADLPAQAPGAIETERMFNDQSVAELARYALAKYQPSVFAVYFKSLDSLQHFQWDYQNYRQQPPEAADYRKKGLKIDEQYQYFDEIVGQFAQLAGPETVVAVVSDHGMVRRDEVPELYSLRTLDGDRILAELGFLQKAEKGTNWRETRAYMFESRIYEWGLEFRLNQQGREPEGIVPEADAGRLRQALGEALLGLKTSSGQPLFLKAEASKRQGDLAVTINNRLTLDDVLVCPASGPVALRDLVIKTPQPAGVHVNAPAGILIAAGGPLKANHRLEKATVFDIAPLLLYLTGLPIPQDLDGKLLEDALRPETLAAHPPRYEGRTQLARHQETLAAQPGDEEVLKELRALGYIQ